MMFAVRSSCFPQAGYIKKMAPKVVDDVKAPNLQVLATAVYRIQKYGGVFKKPKPKIRVAYELYPPDDIIDERWFCHFIKNRNHNTFLGLWCLTNSSSVLDTRYAKPVVFKWCSVKCRVH